MQNIKMKEIILNHSCSAIYKRLKTRESLNSSCCLFFHGMEYTCQWSVIAVQTRALWLLGIKRRKAESGKLLSIEKEWKRIYFGL